MTKIIVFLVLMIFLVGCGSEGKIIPADSGQTGPSNIKIYKGESSTGEKAELSKGNLELSTEVLDIIKKSDSINSLEFSLIRYVENGENYFAKVSSKGNKIKQILDIKSGTYAAGTVYDTVYLDTSKKTVVAYCEDLDTCVGEDHNKEVSVSYGNFVTETPLNILNSIKEGIEEGTAMFDNQETIIIKDKDPNGKTRKIWISEYRGIPLRYEIIDDITGKSIIRVEFKSISVNNVKDSDLEHQNIE